MSFVNNLMDYELGKELFTILNCAKTKTEYGVKIDQSMFKRNHSTFKFLRTVAERFYKTKQLL